MAYRSVIQAASPPSNAVAMAIGQTRITFLRLISSPPPPLAAAGCTSAVFFTGELFSQGLSFAGNAIFFAERMQYFTQGVCNYLPNQCQNYGHHTGHNSQRTQIRCIGSQKLLCLIGLYIHNIVVAEVIIFRLKNALVIYIQ